MPDVLVLRDGDDVAVALRDLAAGESADGPAHGLTVRAAVPAGHKIALRDVRPGAQVRKYGEVIGVAAAPIKAGEHVHVHNLDFVPSDVAHDPGSRLRPVDPPSGEATFQ